MEARISVLRTVVFLFPPRRSRVGTYLCANSVEARIAQRQAKESPDLSDAVRLTADHDKGGWHVLAQANAHKGSGYGCDLTNKGGISPGHRSLLRRHRFEESREVDEVADLHVG